MQIVNRENPPQKNVISHQNRSNPTMDIQNPTHYTISEFIKPSNFFVLNYHKF